MTIPALEHIQDIPPPEQRRHFSKEDIRQMHLKDLAEVYFQPHENPDLPTWLYTPHSHTLANSIPSIPSLEQFARYNQERRLNIMITMTNLLVDNPRPKLERERQRLKELCDDSPILIPAQKLIYTRIIERLRAAVPYWDDAENFQKSFQEFQAKASGVVQPRALEAVGSNPLKPQPRRKAAKPVSQCSSL